MIWLHPALLTGLALTTVPVLLHLLMRAKPKKLVFPALRLIQNRKRTNVRRLRLRHLSLLLLRMAVIALIVMAVARPSVPAADYSLHGGDWLRLSLLAGVALGVYLGLIGLWRRRQLPQHELAYRRSYLRAGLILALLAGIGAFVAWPYQRRISAAITQPTLAPNEFLPVAAVMLFDTSLSMQYRHESRTRLEVTQEIATRHLGSLPRSSRVAIGDTTGDAPIRFQGDLSAANKRIAALTVQPISRPLEDRLLTAIETQLEDEERTSGASQARGTVDVLREIYVFTDLATSAWRKDDAPRLREALTRATGVSVYLIDVGVAAPTNLALTGLALAEQTVPRGGEVMLRATLETTGLVAGERVLELHVENEKGQMVKREQQPVKIDPAAAATVAFPVRGGTGEVLQGELRLLASDPLPFDDVRYFTLQLQPASDVLLVSDDPINPDNDARFLSDALEILGNLRYRRQALASSGLGAADLSKSDVVCLVNVADPKPAGWRALADYVTRGGSALIVLGDRVNHEAYRAPAASDVLPGELKGRVPFDPPEFLDFDLAHPMVRKLPEGAVAMLASDPIYESWFLAPAARDTAVIARYTNVLRRPALVEGAQGKGRVLALTTSLDRRWNNLPVTWSFLPLVDQMLRQLTRNPGDIFNYTIGETVALSLDTSPALTGYRLRKPGLQLLRNEISLGTSRLTVHDTDQIGNYRLTGIEPKTKFERGFSVNAEPAESDLRRMTKDELDTRLGVDRYSLARDIENLQRNVRAGRLGRDAFPLVALVLLAVFVGEHFIANRFYSTDAPRE